MLIRLILINTTPTAAERVTLTKRRESKRNQSKLLCILQDQSCFTKWHIYSVNLLTGLQYNVHLSNFFFILLLMAALVFLSFSFRVYIIKYNLVIIFVFLISASTEPAKQQQEKVLTTDLESDMPLI